MKLMKMLSAIFALLFFCQYSAMGQQAPDLPNIQVLTQGGINIVSWNNTYESGLKSIAVQRSADSNYNFSTVGYVADLKKGPQSFVDAHPMMGKNWYRLEILFTSDFDWKSNLGSVEVDSNSIANRNPLPPSDSLQKIVSASNSAAAIANVNTVTYPKSQYVFSNPFTGNINIEIPDAAKENYMLIFYNQNDKEVLRIPRVNEKVVILDRRNFQTTGMFKFKLFKNKEEFDKGYLTIY